MQFLLFVHCVQLLLTVDNMKTNASSRRVSALVVVYL